MFLGNNGNVGVGITAPATTLDIGGIISENGTQVLYLPNQTNFTGSLIVGNSGGSLTHSSGSDAFHNTLVGMGASAANTTGSNNTVLGNNALGSNTTGANNTVLGYQALASLTGSWSNTAVGESSLSNTWGNYNTAVGAQTGIGAWSGNNIANTSLFGYQSGYNLLNGGSNNTFLGYQSGYNVTSGASNVMIGYQPGYYQTTNSNLLIIDNQARGSAGNPTDSTSAFFTEFSTQRPLINS